MHNESSALKKPVLQYTVLAALLAWALLAQLTFSGFLVYVQATASRNVWVPFVMEDYGTRIVRVSPPYFKSGLQSGDELVALDGVPFEGRAQLDEEWAALHPNQTLTVTVKRSISGSPRILSIPIRMSSGHPPALRWILTIALSVVLPLGGLLVGFYIAFARPLDPLAWITMAMLASFGQLAGSGASWAIWPPWRELLFVYHPLLSNSWPLWMVLFALYFPAPFPFIQRHRWIAWVIATPSAALAAFDIYGYFTEGHHLRDLHWLASFERSISAPVTLLFTIYVFAFFFFLGWKTNVVTTPDARRRLRVMINGCCISLLPLLPVVFGQLGFIPLMPPWLVGVCLSMLLFFPATMAYVIVVQRAMDVRMVIRSGVQYALASTGVRVLQILLAILVVFLTIHFVQESEHKLYGMLIAAVGVALLFTLGRAAQRVRQWMDRRFFREAYDAELILTELSGSVAGIHDTRTLLETVSKRLAESLHVPRIAVFLERGDRYQPAYALGFSGASPAVDFKRDAPTVRFLQRQHAPSRVYFDDPQSWVHGTSEHEQNALRKLDTQVLLPLTLKNRLMGVISLSSKKSEVPYSKGDLKLLSAVASQTGLALENAELAESIRHEVAQRVRLDRDLEIAREVQQRLFPQKLPVVIGLDFAGYCRPALGVGGDYYDFIRLSNGCLGIAIGDVSGKGIGAALMMASLQASLRGQTIKPSDTLSEMIELINRLVYDASADNRYATFFYAQYEPATRLLRYVNAGHNPPLVYRQREDHHEFLRLEEGGTVVGLFPNYRYREARLYLESGDIVVAFTDGISEAMNHAEEEFDEERLIQALRTCNARSAADIIKYVLDEVDGFTSGAPQHDDMTLVVMRVQ